MKKTVFKTFRYTECDQFAAYLEEMAAKGWHLKEWRAGLVFEKGQPSRETFCVEVFPKGREMDFKAEEDAREYGEYCLAAGWELVDARRKFCIFRRISEDALPIVTPKERLENVKKAEWNNWRVSAFTLGIICLCQWLIFSASNGRIWLFHNLMLTLFCCGNLAFLGKLIEGVYLFLVCRREEKKRRALPGIGVILFRLLYLFILVISLMEREYAIAAVLAGFLVILGLLELLVRFFRPSRTVYLSIQMAGSVMLVLTLALVGALIASQADTRKGVVDYIPEEEMPLQAKDYREISAPVVHSTGYEMKGVLGSVKRYEIDYGEEGKEPGYSDFVTVTLAYEIYESPYPLVLDRVWNLSVKEPVTDMTEAWEAERAAYSSGRYCVQYEGRMAVLYIQDKLGKEEIQTIRKKLELG